MTARERSEIYRLVHEKRHEIEAIAAKYKATNVRVFGSVARGSARSDSDIDFLVTFLPGADAWGVMGMEIELEQLLGRTVEVVGDDSLRENWRDGILREAQPL
jgi:predicted nucleotidyltransferase